MLHAALPKLRAPARFASAVDAWQLLPAGAGRWLALPLALAEAACALALPWASTRLAGALLAGLLLALYAGAIALALRSGHTDFDCGCGTGRALRPSGLLLARNLALLGCCALAARVPAVPAGAADIAVALLLAAVLLLLYVGCNALAARLQWPGDD